MTVRNVKIEGDKVLRDIAHKVDKIDSGILKLITDMKETMYHCDGIGIAAPQIGVSKRVIIIDIGEGPIVCINPKIVKAHGEDFDLEGCLSIPGVEEEVKRPKKVKVVFMDENSRVFEIKASGILARAFCHEIDHLDGILFTDRVNKKEN
ncbi:MAG: peptide deformylase [Clostridium sp.]